MRCPTHPSSPTLRYPTLQPSCFRCRTVPRPGPGGEGLTKRGNETALKNRRNTTKAYNRPQKLWKEFCTKFDFEDKEFVSTAKHLFTQQVVLELTVQPQRQRKAKGKGKRKAAEVEEEDIASSGDDIDKEKSFEVAADVIDDGLR